MSTPVIRSLLFVPGNKGTLIEKAIHSQADAVIIDLEDAVLPADKVSAREVTKEALQYIDRAGKPVFVRVNAFDSGLTATDLAAVMNGAPWGVVLPKAIDEQCVTKLSHFLEVLEAREGLSQLTKILTISTESAESTLKLSSLPTQVNKRLWGTMWGDEDLSISLGAISNTNELGELTLPYQYARTKCLYAANATKIQPVDSVYVNFRDNEGLAKAAKAAFNDGFTAKAAIHPSQAEIINNAMTPSNEQIEWAKQVLDILQTSGVGQINGKMINVLHRTLAERIISLAKTAL
jgi:citrate lyase subunit beta / citryl-CoA lyase